DFRYLATHLNMGFSCGSIYRRDRRTARTSLRVQLDFEKANPNCRSQLLDPDGTFTHYYGGSSGTIENVSRYQRLRFEGVWDGVAVEYEGLLRGITMRFHVRSVAELRLVRLSSEGLSASGDSLVSTLGSFRISASQSGSESRSESRPVPVEARYEQGAVTFWAPSANPMLPIELTLDMPVDVEDDPVVAGWDANYSRDNEGNLYFTARTTNYAVFAPRPSGALALCAYSFQATECSDSYLAAFDKDGKLRYLVYFRGEREDLATGLHVDGGGNVFVSGSTYSRDFVTTPGSVQTAYRGPEEMRPRFRSYSGGDGFVLKIHGPTGGLIWSTLIGTQADDDARLLGVDADGRPWLWVSSLGSDLPLRGEPILANAPCCDRLMSLSEDASTIRFSHAAPLGAFALSPSGTGYLLVTSGQPTPHVTVTRISSAGLREFETALPPEPFPPILASRGDEGVWVISSGAPGMYGGWDLHAIDSKGELVSWDAAGAGKDVWLTSSRIHRIPVTENAVISTPCEACTGPACAECSGLLRVDGTGVRFATYLPFRATIVARDASRLFLAADSRTRSQQIYVLDEADGSTASDAQSCRIAAR
ncbi:MAG: hypothetical protein JNL98_35700, partial [Bryobacterales bacterium]|nr:hypothetical protein [Bryobacterales bacterium]